MEIRTETTTTYEMSFLYKDDLNAGFGFPCDKSGVVDTGSLEDCGLKNYEWCKTHRELFDIQLEKQQSSEKHGICDCCGKMVWVFPDRYGEFRCPGCGQLYNAFGQRLDKSAWDLEDADW